MDKRFRTIDFINNFTQTCTFREGISKLMNGIMENGKTIFMFFFIWFINAVSAQTSNVITIVFTPSYGSMDLMLEDSIFHTNDSNNLKIETLKFYISHIQFLKKGVVVLEEQNSFHLIDASRKKSLSINIHNNQNIVFDQLKFNLGIDSICNVSGAMGGDLDPTKGMYWTWQSGYINFKLEGKSKMCATRNNEFQFHLGGYQQPFYNLQTMIFSVNEIKRIQVIVDVKEIINQIDLSVHNHIMSPNKEAVMISAKIPEAFSIKEK